MENVAEIADLRAKFEVGSGGAAGAGGGGLSPEQQREHDELMALKAEMDKMNMTP